VSKTPLIVRLGEMFYKENAMDFAFGFPSLRHAKLQSLRLGGEGYRLVRLYRKAHFKKYPLTWTLRVKEGWEFFKKDGSAGIASLLKRGEEGLSKENILHLVKDEKYLRWRYIDHPSKKYRLLAFKRMTGTKGFIIFTIDEEWVNILEVFYEKINDVKGIFVALEIYLFKNMASIKGISLWLHPLEPLRKEVEKCGFRSEDNIPIAFKSVNASCGVTSKVFYDSYFYRMGDYDAS